jgi:hypothetical protein
MRTERATEAPAGSKKMVTGHRWVAIGLVGEAALQRR